MPALARLKWPRCLLRPSDDALIRLQCYEGLDVAAAVYEWSYARQMMEIRLAEVTGEQDHDRLTRDVFSAAFLIKRPLLRAFTRRTPPSC